MAHDQWSRLFGCREYPCRSRQLASSSTFWDQATNIKDFLEQRSTWNHPPRPDLGFARRKSAFIFSLESPLGSNWKLLCFRWFGFNFIGCELVREVRFLECHLLFISLIYCCGQSVAQRCQRSFRLFFVLFGQRNSDVKMTIMTEGWTITNFWMIQIHIWHRSRARLRWLEIYWVLLHVIARMTMERSTMTTGYHPWTGFPQTRASRCLLLVSFLGRFWRINLSFSVLVGKILLIWGDRIMSHWSRNLFLDVHRSL